MRVNLLFGFLGSGKTTLAKHLLAQRDSDMKTAVIVNEFGEVGIDGDILRGSNVDVVELNSGCLCCTLRGSLMLAVEELRDKAQVERVIVEATGVAQPGELLETLADSSMQGGLDIGPLVTVVDVNKFPKLLSMLGDFYVDQIENADIVILNKIDLVTPAQLEDATRQLREVNPDADLLFAEQGRVRPGELFEKRGKGMLEKVLADGAGQQREPTHEHSHDHHHHDQGGSGHDHDPHADAPAQSFVVRGAGNATRAGVQRFFGSLPGNVWRAKGFMHIDGRPALMQYSLGQLEITPAEAVRSEAVVFIGNGMDRPAIEAAFALAARP
jgi:G3E family GTPase